MFEKKLAEQLQKIFDVKKVSYDQPSPETYEQEALYVEIETSWNTFGKKRVRAKVTGNVTMVGPNDKIPFGFFSKAIHEADKSLTKDFFFFDIEVNTKRYQNLVQRGFSFVYFFDSQYDPDTGSITSVEFIQDEEQ
jgi:hypothetical protein